MPSQQNPFLSTMDCISPRHTWAHWHKPRQTWNAWDSSRLGIPVMRHCVAPSCYLHSTRRFRIHFEAEKHWGASTIRAEGVIREGGQVLLHRLWGGLQHFRVSTFDDSAGHSLAAARRNTERKSFGNLSFFWSVWNVWKGCQVFSKSVQKQALHILAQFLFCQGSLLLASGSWWTWSLSLRNWQNPWRFVRLLISCWLPLVRPASASCWSIACRTWRTARCTLVKPVTRPVPSLCWTFPIPWNRKPLIPPSKTGTTCASGFNILRIVAVERLQMADVLVWWASGNGHCRSNWANRARFGKWWKAGVKTACPCCKSVGILLLNFPQKCHCY